MYRPATSWSRHANVRREHINKQFGGYTQALRECNLERPGNKEVKLDVLFRDWAGIVRKQAEETANKL